MIIDGHIHLGGRFSNYNNLLSSMDEAGIKKAVVVPYMFKKNNIFKHYLLPPWLLSNRFVQKSIPRILKMNLVKKNYVLRPNNFQVLQLKKRYPDRFITNYWVNPNFNHDIKVMELEILRGNFQGVKIHQIIHPFNVLSVNFEEILDITDKFRIPLFIHIDKEKDFEKIMYQAKNRKKTKFIIAHLDYFDIYLDKYSNIDNIYFDVSPISTAKLLKIKKFLAKMGSHKLIFGTDSPCPGGQKYAINKIDSLQLKTEDYENIFWKNYTGLFN